MYILLFSYKLGGFWQEYDTFRTIDAALLIMNTVKQDYPNRFWKIAKFIGE